MTAETLNQTTRSPSDTWWVPTEVQQGVRLSRTAASYRLFTPPPPLIGPLSFLSCVLAGGLRTLATLTSAVTPLAPWRPAAGSQACRVHGETVAWPWSLNPASNPATYTKVATSTEEFDLGSVKNGREGIQANGQVAQTVLQIRPRLKCYLGWFDFMLLIRINLKQS